MRSAVRSLRFPVVMLVALASFLLVFVVYGAVMYQYLPSGADRADFGSMFGALGAFFGSIALLGVAWALRLQHEAAERDKQRFERDEEAFHATMRLSALSLLAPWVEEQVKWLEGRGELLSDGAQEMMAFRTRLFQEVEKLAGLDSPVTEEAKRQAAARAEAESSFDH